MIRLFAVISPPATFHPRLRRLRDGLAPAGLLCGVWLLSACASQGPVPGTVSILPDTYSVTGRVAVNADGRGYSASFTWQHHHESDRVDVSNPLGQILARLELAPGVARLVDADGVLQESDDIEGLAESRLGWRLPVRGMRYWLLGLADPTRFSAASQDEAQRRVLQQDGWQITYTADDGKAPTRMVLQRPDLEVRVALYEWQLSAEARNPP